jgi:hypothetical protein
MKIQGEFMNLLEKGISAGIGRGVIHGYGFLD